MLKELYDVLRQNMLTTFLKLAIDDEVSPQKEEGEQIHDHIDDAVDSAYQAKLYQVCFLCKSLVLKRKRNCTIPGYEVNHPYRIMKR